MKYLIDTDTMTVVLVDEEVPPAPNPDPDPNPDPPPAPTPIPETPPGWTVVVNPLTVNPAPGGFAPGVPLDIDYARIYVFHCPANTIHAFPIVFNPAVYSGSGAAFQTNQIVVNPNRRDMVISDAPGKLVPINNSFAGRVLNNAEHAALYVSFTNPPPASMLLLEKGKQYWLNIKPTNPGEPMDYYLKPDSM